MQLISVKIPCSIVIFVSFRSNEKFPRLPIADTTSKMTLMLGLATSNWTSATTLPGLEDNDRVSNLKSLWFSFLKSVCRRRCRKRFTFFEYDVYNKKIKSLIPEGKQRSFFKPCVILVQRWHLSENKRSCIGQCLFLTLKCIWSEIFEYLSRLFLYRTKTLYNCYTHHKVQWYVHGNISMQHNGLPAALSIQKVKKSEFSSIKKCSLLVLFIKWVWANMDITQHKHKKVLLTLEKQIRHFSF